eukprot:GHVH01016812.1.p2 GENE.GHVH01016812.1~~GHVH01016812.1.p2  ORF type:complete len:289 (-),score=38.58 GHVH01016812.1:2188-3054(-)
MKMIIPTNNEDSHTCVCKRVKIKWLKHKSVLMTKKIQYMPIWGTEIENEVEDAYEPVTREKSESNNDEWNDIIESLRPLDVGQAVDSCFICGSTDRKFDQGLYDTGHVVCQSCMIWARDYNGSYNMISQCKGLKDSGLSMNDLTTLGISNMLVLREKPNPNPAAKHPMKLYYQFQLAAAAMAKSDFWWNNAVKRLAILIDDPILDNDIEVQAQKNELLFSNQESLAKIIRARYRRQGEIEEDATAVGFNHEILVPFGSGHQSCRRFDEVGSLHRSVSTYLAQESTRWP